MDNKKDELTEHISTSFIFNKETMDSQSMNSDIWSRYLPYSSGKKIKKSGECLIEIGEVLNGVYYIHKGKVMSYMLGRDGTEKTLNITYAGCIFGEQFVFHGQPSLYKNIVVEDAEIYFFEKNTFLDLIMKDQKLNLFVLKSLAFRSRRLAAQVQDMSLRNIKQRICNILYSLACYEQKANSSKENIYIDISHQDLSNLLASHRVTITKNLNSLKKEGIIDYKYERILIKDIKKLKEIAFDDID